jgi:hypothetical protein
VVQACARPAADATRIKSATATHVASLRIESDYCARGIRAANECPTFSKPPLRVLQADLPFETVAKTWRVATPPPVGFQVDHV